MSGTAVQRQEALKLANATRLEMASTRNEIAAMDRADALNRCADLLADPPKALLRMRVGRLLTSVNRLGPAFVDRMLARGGVTPGVSGWAIGRLSIRQREYLAELLRDMAGR